MVYAKQTWANGPAGATPLNADRLNYMENGIEDVEADLTAALNTQTHPISEVTGLQAALDAKPDTIGEIPGLQAELDNKAETIADIPGLQTQLDNKVPTSTTGIKLDHGTSLPTAGQAGRLFVLHA